MAGARSVYAFVDREQLLVASVFPFSLSFVVAITLLHPFRPLKGLLEESGTILDRVAFSAGGSLVRTAAAPFVDPAEHLFGPLDRVERVEDELRIGRT